VEIVQEIGSYAGFAAVVGLAILSALYFSQARDVKRLREWAGRAPERAAELEEGSRAAAAVPVAARPQPQVRAPGAGAAAGGAAAGAARTGAAAGATAPAGAAAGATAPAGAAASSAGASPATATAGAPALAGADAAEDEDLDAAGDAREPVPAGASGGVGAATAAGTAANGSEEAAEADAEADAGAEQPVGTPAAATPAGAVASAAGTAERAGPGTADRAATGAVGTTGVTRPGDTGTGAKVLPARRPTPPVRPRPTIPPTRAANTRPGQGSVLTQPPGSRPTGRRGGRNWPAPRYIALIIAGIVILGLGGTVGLMQLTKDDPQQQTETPPVTDLEDPTRAPDPPDDTPAIDPGSVTVAVLNATTTNGLAARVGSQLEGAGFQTGNLTNAAERARTESVVMYKPGKTAEARTVARRLDIGSTEPIDTASQALVGDADVVVVLGADKAQQ
jgi:hypothetical protein